MGFDVLSSEYNFEPQYMVTMLRREDWIKTSAAPPSVKRPVWFTDGLKM